MLPQDERVHGLSGWAPRYVDPVVVHYAKTLAQDKMPFGSDLPALTPSAGRRSPPSTTSRKT